MFRSMTAIVLILVSCQSSPKPEAAKTDAPMMAETPMPGGEVTFKAPDAWVAETPASSQRKAQFKLPGRTAAEDAELGVFFFPSAGGSVDANLTRWYGQFKQPDGSSTKEKAKFSQLKVNGLLVSVVYLTGSYMKPRVAGMMGGPVDETPGYAMRAAIVETSNGPWFFKAVGPQTTIDQNQASFDAFVQTFALKP